MKLTLVVFGFLCGIILAPIDGRLKYAEILPGVPYDRLLGSPSGAEQDGEREPAINRPAADEPYPSARDPTMDGMDVSPSDGKEVAVTSVPLNCFPSADRLHKYDWARYYLRHLAAEAHRDVNAVGFDQRRPTAPDDTPDMRLAKRSEFTRELSADLYAQYPSSCACQTKYELLDLGYTHFPRYIVNAICQNRSANSRKCWRGSSCKEIPYKVRVLTKRTDGESGEQDHHSTLLPEPLREYWRFKTVTIAAACQCSI